MIDEHRSGATGDTTADASPDTNSSAIISWRGVTVALSRERVITERPPDDDSVASPPPEMRGREAKISNSSCMEEGSSILEPLLPPGANEEAPLEDHGLCRGGGESAPAFLLEGVSLEVRRGEVRGSEGRGYVKEHAVSVH